MGVESVPGAKRLEEIRRIASKSDDDEAVKPDYNFKFSAVSKCCETTSE